MSTVASLIQEILPHAPDQGLFKAPDIPPRKLRRAIKNMAPSLKPDQVLALFDATLLRTGGDGVLFAPTGLYYQNNNLQAPQFIPYAHVVGVREKKSLLGGRTLEVDANAGRTIVTHQIDFSAHPDMAAPVRRFLEEAMFVEEQTSEVTDRKKVQEVLQRLVAEGSLSKEDFRRIMKVLDT